MKLINTKQIFNKFFLHSRDTKTDKTLSELFINTPIREKVVDEAMRESIGEQKELLSNYRVSARLD